MPAKNTAPAVKLPDDVKKQLQSLDTSIEAAETGVKTLQKLGMDVSSITDKLTWAKSVRTTLLEDFT